MPQAIIIGAGEGLSASLARLLARNGYAIALAARNAAKLAPLAAETHATTHACDVADAAQVESLFAATPTPDVVLFNPSFRARGPIAALDPADVRRALDVSAYGGFLVAQQAVRRMEPRGTGCILLTGASASVKGFPQSAPFAMGKFALRGLAESMARELHPKGIHIAHLVIDGGIARPGRDAPRGEDSLLQADAIAETCLHIIRQPRNAWTHEITLRPWTEPF